MSAPSPTFEQLSLDPETRPSSEVVPQSRFEHLREVDDHIVTSHADCPVCRVLGGLTITQHADDAVTIVCASGCNLVAFTRRPPTPRSRRRP